MILAALGCSWSRSCRMLGEQLLAPVRRTPTRGGAPGTWCCGPASRRARVSRPFARRAARCCSPRGSASSGCRPRCAVHARTRTSSTAHAPLDAAATSPRSPSASRLPRPSAGSLPGLPRDDPRSVLVAARRGHGLVPDALPVLGVRAWDPPVQARRRRSSSPRRAPRRPRPAAAQGRAARSASPATAIAVLFLLHGAPDLALTQVLVETLTLVVFVLVLRRLPPTSPTGPLAAQPLAAARDRRSPSGGGGRRVALVAPGARDPRAGVVRLRRARPTRLRRRQEHRQRTLVDIRAWDTMGEISVLARRRHRRRLAWSSCAAQRRDRRVPARRRATARGSGESADARRRRRTEPRGRRAGRRRPAGPRPVAASAWRCGPDARPQRRSVIFEVVTRLLFHTMIVCSRCTCCSAGHNTPGGGFAAGLVAGLALIVRYLAGGRYELGEAAPVHPGLLLGPGCSCPAGVGLVALLAGGEVLQSRDPRHPPAGASATSTW